jgi:hypothetical protein
VSYLIFKILFFNALLLVSTTGYAKLDFEDHAFPQFVTSARALAMGNAYMNKVDDSWSAFYNPAGLGTVRKHHFHLFNGHIEASNTVFDLVTGGPFYQIPSNYADTFDIEGLRTELANIQGKLAHTRLNFFPNITVRGLTLGYLFSQTNRGIINDDVANEFEVAERRDQGPVLALNGSFLGGVLKLGVSAVYLTRRELFKTFSPTTPVGEFTSQDYKNGRGLQVTGGGRLTLPFTMLPTLSVVLRNATANGWEGVSGEGAPDKIKQTADFGFSITPQIGRRSRFHLETNIMDVGNAYGTDIKRRLAIGAEIDFNRRMFLRAGYGDGWGSGGIGVRSQSFILDLTTYAIDTSQTGFREQEDRRWVFSLSSGF